MRCGKWREAWIIGNGMENVEMNASGFGRTVRRLLCVVGKYDVMARSFCSADSTDGQRGLAPDQTSTRKRGFQRGHFVVLE